MEAKQGEWGLIQPGDYVADQTGTVWHVDMIAVDSHPIVHLRSAEGECVTMPLPSFDRAVTVMRPTEAEIEQMIENFVSKFAGAERKED